MNDLLPESDWWTRCYGGVAPIGHELRFGFPERWMRIHSLPDSKRYPDDEEDWQILFARHRHAASMLFEEGDRVFVITPWSCLDDPSFSPFSLRPDSALPGFRPCSDDAPTGAFHRSSMEWSFEAVAPIVAAVAEWRTLAAFVSADASKIYAPYDGGADLFFTRSEDLAGCREALSAYLSPRADGL